LPPRSRGLRSGEPAGDGARVERDVERDEDPLAALHAFIGAQTIDKSADKWKMKLPKPPLFPFDPAKTYFWLLNTTEGPIKIRLMPDAAPMHVSSTLYLTELGFYDGLRFHRVIPGFMAQGGDPLGIGAGGPGYKYAGEFSPKARHSKAGILAMANAGPGTDGSQFYLTFKARPELDNGYTVFGEVVDGLDNLMKMEKYGSESGKTSKPLLITTAKVQVQ
jgi:cyclophilin family peptidyl-prolyl cis-trans isomerase